MSKKLKYWDGSKWVEAFTVPEKTSELTNDSGFLTSHQSLSNYYTKTQVDNAIATAITTALNTAV